MEFNINKRNREIAIIITVAAMVILAAIIISLAFEFNLVENLVMSWIFTTFYSIFGFLVVGDTVRIIRVEKPVYIEKPVIKEIIRTIEKPVEVIKEVPIQIPIENRTIEVVEKPVIQRVEVPIIKWVEKKVYMERKKLNIPKFNYIASSETKTFHKRNCRFGKLIKRKYKVHNNKSSWFQKNHFKACKVCLKK